MKAAASCPFGKMQKDASQSILFLFQNIFSRFNNKLQLYKIYRCITDENSVTYKHQNEDDY